jgi:hypothetical protein
MEVTDVFVYAFFCHALKPRERERGAGMIGKWMDRSIAKQISIVRARRGARAALVSI